MTTRLSWRYVRHSWRSSLSLGVFLFFLGLLLVLAQSLTYSAKRQMNEGIVKALTGHVQILSRENPEKDMADVFSTIWQNKYPLKPEQTQNLKDILPIAGEKSGTGVRVVPRIRLSAMMISDSAKSSSMVIALDAAHAPYGEVMELESGHLPRNEDEIVLPIEVAKELKVKPGDSITLLIPLPDSASVDVPFRVSGVGNLRMLSLFGFSVSYCNLSWIEKSAELAPGKDTDIIVFLDDPSRTSRFKAELDVMLGREGRDLRITSGEGMGGFMQSIAAGMGWIFYGMLGFLMIIMCALIINLIFAVGLDRFRDIGTLRAIGFSRLRVCFIFLKEILFVALISIGSGVVLGLAIVAWFSKNGIIASDSFWRYVMGKVLYLQVDPSTLIVSIGIAFAFTVITAFYPAWVNASVPPATVMKD